MTRARATSRAILRLERQGLVNRHVGRGTFVADQRVRRLLR